jgi:hypothetical protein
MPNHNRRFQLLELLIAGLIGAFVGWNIPQPWWAVYIQEKITGYWKS